MFSDPQSVTIGTAQSLPRTGISGNAGTFTKDDGTVALGIAHSQSKRGRVRSTARIDYSKIVADPLITGTNLRLSASAYIVIDKPINGFTVAEQVQLITGLTTWLTSSTNANATKLGGGEV
ncbi:TPA_asm: coat protein [ssRNA phage Zoerhiza.2_2]|uniref:Coat protein n=2 Tax=Leviviricetes TaxID=2842243 RepID=A0A8S5L2M7_9VIRU|nr:coat protein [ssRNA phage Zoerhiza.2_2]QDH87605.1 MAG: hypothetical protein H2Rhizo31354_000002 [Leviviridae sp.]DAD51621.1 TPA_asm: coat protein [ssRNA phage Zoerhiza.2_2]